MRHFWWLLLVIVMALVIGVGIKLRGQALDCGTLTGEVYYTEAAEGGARTRVPISGAQITVTGVAAHATSDHDGVFRLTALPAGKYDLIVTHPRFRDPFTASVTVSAGTATNVEAEMGQGYCVAVGIGTYADRDIPELVGPVYDVKAIDRALFHNFQGHATLLINKQGTKARIKAAIESAASRMSPRDFFIFYFSGHGGSDRLRRKGVWINYLLPYDSHSDSYAHDITEAELAHWLQELPDPHRAMLILDSCNSGAFISGRQRHAQNTQLVSPSSPTPLQKLGCTVLAAARSNEKSVDTDDGSLFTDELIKGLERQRAKVDAEHHHAITVKALFNYAALITAAEAKTFDEQQHPQLLEMEDQVLLRY